MLSILATLLYIKVFIVCRKKNYHSAFRGISWNAPTIFQEGSNIHFWDIGPY